MPEQAGPGANVFSVHVAGIPARLAACHRDVRQLRWLRVLGRTGMAGTLREGRGFSRLTCSDIASPVGLASLGSPQGTRSAFSFIEESCGFMVVEFYE